MSGSFKPLSPAQDRASAQDSLAHDEAHRQCTPRFGSDPFTLE